MMDIRTIMRINLIYIWVCVMCKKPQGSDANRSNESLSDSVSNLSHSFCNYVEHQQAASRDHCSCYSHILCNPTHGDEVIFTCHQGYKLTGPSRITTLDKTLADLIGDIPECDETTTATATVAETTAVPTTMAETTPATAATVAETTAVPSTVAQTTAVPSTVAETTAVPTTVAETTAVPTIVVETTAVPTTVAETTPATATVAETTEVPSTVAETTAVPTTVAETTAVLTTVAETTAVPTTVAETTAVPTTMAETTTVPTTMAETTPATTTVAETTAKDDSPIIYHCPDNLNHSNFCSILTTVRNWGTPSPNVSWSVEGNKWYISFRESLPGTGTYIGLPVLDGYNGTFCLSIKYRIIAWAFMTFEIFFQPGKKGIKLLEVYSDPVSLMWELEKEPEVWLMSIGRFEPYPTDWTFILHTLDIVLSSCPY